MITAKVYYPGNNVISIGVFLFYFYDLFIWAPFYVWGRVINYPIKNGQKSSRYCSLNVYYIYNIFISGNRRDTILIHKMGKEVYRHVCIYWSKKMPFCCRRRRCSAMQVLKTSHKKSQGPIWYLRKQANVITVSCYPYMYCMVCFCTHKYSWFWFRKKMYTHVIGQRPSSIIHV